MADQEVIKHTKRVYKIWTNKENSLWHKLKDFVLEILIIVFAVSLSIWLHSRTEHSHQQKDVKEFFIGLQQDLVSDTLEMNEDKKSFRGSSAAFNYISSIKLRDSLNTDSIRKYMPVIFNSTGLVPNSGRFEGFKSSGKIGTIENKVLQDDIMDLYQELIPLLIAATDHYAVPKQKFADYYRQNLKRINDSTFNTAQVFKSDESYNLSRNLVDIKQIIKQYDACIKKIREILEEIEKEYK